LSRKESFAFSWNAGRARPLKRNAMLLRTSRTNLSSQLILSFGIVVAGNLTVPAQTMNPTLSPGPIYEKREQEVADEDKVYSGKEVDVKAKVIRPLDNLPAPGTDCRTRMRLEVSVSAVLHRSGEVRNAELIKDSGCNSYDKDALRAVGQMKFLRALKDSRFVSQYQMFEFKFSRF
jgi:outer membrane biosynthesis protein TonB